MRMLERVVALLASKEKALSDRAATGRHRMLVDWAVHLGLAQEIAVQQVAWQTVVTVRLTRVTTLAQAAAVAAAITVAVAVEVIVSPQERWAVAVAVAVRA